MGRMEKSDDRLLSALEALADSSRDIPVPAQIDDHIRRGMAKASAERSKGRRASKVWWSAAAAAVIMIAAFTTSIRISPVFAAYVRDIPGMSYIVGLIAEDKGLIAAVNNDFIQPIGESQTHDGITVTVDGIIADETRMNIFYTIRYPEEYGEVELTGIRFRLEDGTLLSGGYSWGYQRSEGAGTGEQSNRILVNFMDGVTTPDSFVLETSVERDQSVLEPTWSFPIKIDREKLEAQKVVYPIGKTVEIDGQRITFVSAAVHPTQIAVEVEFDPGNTKKIFSFVDLELIGDNGEKYQVSGSQIRENGQTIYFQGSLFTMPESLTLTGSTIRALDQDQLEIVVNTETGELLKAPDDKVKLKGITKPEDGGLALNFTLSGITKNDTTLYSLPDAQFTDGSGKEYYMGVGGMVSSSDGQNEQEHIFYVADRDYVQPLTFKVTSYPSYIKGDFEVKIK